MPPSDPTAPAQIAPPAKTGAEIDPVLSAFLAFLERDLARHPGRLGALGPGLRDRLTALAARGHTSPGA